MIISPQHAEKLNEILEVMSTMIGSRYECAESVRDWSQSIMDAERDNRITELRRIANEGEAAAKELVELGAVGAPRHNDKQKARDKRKAEKAARKKNRR